jgi:hypothetical protein
MGSWFDADLQWIVITPEFVPGLPGKWRRNIAAFADQFGPTLALAGRPTEASDDKPQFYLTKH